MDLGRKKRQAAIASLIETFGGPPELAAVIGKTSNHVKQMQRDGAIAGWHWWKIDRAAKKRGIWPTAEALAKIHHRGDAR